MATVNEKSLVSVYTSPVETGAEIVRNMLVANGIRATVAESSGPFTGLPVAPSEVLVWEEEEAEARALIALAEAHQHDFTAVDID